LASQVAFLLCALLVGDRADAQAKRPGRQVTRPRTESRMIVRSPLPHHANTARGSSGLVRPGRALPSDDWTFRPTVIIRRGTSQGSGTIIASVDAETLVLTAAHVVQDQGPTLVELHRYNLGLEQAAAPGIWPRVVTATLAASDSGTDLAVLRIDGLTALPFVARLALERQDPPGESIVTSVGIDLGVKLGSWTTRLLETRRFELNDNGAAHPFLLTAHRPEHGRSGGGLFLPSGELLGVCIGHTEITDGHSVGVYSAWESIHRLLDDHGLAVIVALSESRRPRPKEPSNPQRSNPSESAPPLAAPTQAVPGERGSP
jgi:S1-C subfamily serine protease